LQTWITLLLKRIFGQEQQIEKLREFSSGMLGRAATSPILGLQDNQTIFMERIVSFFSAVRDLRIEIVVEDMLSCVKSNKRLDKFILEWK
jgi:hypothetical protein